MAPVTQDLNDMQTAIRKALIAHWRLCIFQGAIMIGLGVLAIIAPVVATIAVGIFLGWIFLIGGIVGLVTVFAQRNIAAFLWNLITAALAIVVGILLIWNPVEGALSLTIVLTAFFIVEGIFQIAASLAYRDVMGGSWGWMLVSGLCDLALAAIIILGWPVSATWAIGLLVGVNLITSGWAMVMVAIAGRDLARAL